MRRTNTLSITPGEFEYFSSQLVKDGWEELPTKGEYEVGRFRKGIETLLAYKGKNSNGYPRIRIVDGIPLYHLLRQKESQ